MQDPWIPGKNPNNHDSLDLPVKITNYDMNLIRIMDILGSVTLRIRSEDWTRLMQCFTGSASSSTSGMFAVKYIFLLINTSC